MTQKRSIAPARSGHPLVARVVLPLAALALLLALAVTMLVAGAGRKAAEKELDARAATVKKAWDAADRPTADRQLDRLGAQLGARLSVVRGQRPQAGTTDGGFRRYAFATRDRQTLRVALSTSESDDALSSGLIT